MPFRLRDDAEKWFSEIDGQAPLKTKFDLYYFCVMAGLAGRRKSEPVPSHEIIDEFIQDYRPAKRLLIGLMVIAEVHQGGMGLEEKTAVRDVFKRLITSDNATGLTDDGMRCMNSYASGGYEFLAESRETKPTSPEEFLRDYVQLVDLAAKAAV